MPSLSIIIPVYNVEQYLKQCLDSILVDNHFTGQVICVNDGSTDGSLAILEQYAKKAESGEFKVESFLVINQPNGGLSAARNAGLKKASGDYVFFPDSDDWVLPNSLEKIISKIDGEDVVYFNAKVCSDEKQCFEREIDIPTLHHMTGSAYFAAIYDKPRNMPCVCVCGGIFLRSFLIENRLYNEPGIYHEDNYFTPQVLLAAKDVSCVNEYVYVYRIRQGSITAHVTVKHIKDMLFVARNLYAKYEERKDVPDVFYKDVCQIYINLIGKVYCNSLSLSRYWRISDGRRMLRCAYDARSRKIAKLACLSPRLAYGYMKDTLPSLMRRCINRWA